MANRSLPEHPNAPAGRGWLLTWRGRAVLGGAVLLVAAVVMARVIVQPRQESARVERLQANPPAAPAAEVMPEVATALPQETAAERPQAAVADIHTTSEVALAAQPVPAAAVADGSPSDSLAWTYQDVPCNARHAATPESALHRRHASVAVESAGQCGASRVMALVDTKPRAQGAPAPAAFSATAMAAGMAAHPRLILDNATLTVLRQRAANNTPQWKALKAKCDSYIGGTVQFPSGNAYPNLPNLGSGYQGSDYVPALLAEGMCYQVLKTSDASSAAKYGAKAVDILMKMSATGSQGQPPCTDSGYGIRFYGVGMGLGYDWVWDLLSADQRTQIYTTANSWITAWEQPNGCADFEYVHPQSNYFAGYFHAKAAIALATYDENPSAPAQWSDWLNNQFAKRVQPYYQQHLLGGGWPEGYANYAPLGIMNMSLPIREVMTATGTDLLHAAAPYTYPVDSGDYLMHFTWPSRAYFDDRDTNRSGSGSATQPPGTTQVGLFQQVLGALQYWGAPNTAIFREYLAEVSAATNGFGSGDAWLQFLSIDPAGATASVSGLPLSYFAPGLGAVAARSDWGQTAAWMSFRAAPYANNPGQGEEYFDQGSLALVRGGTPLLLNATGWLVHDPNGTNDENQIYTDNFGSFSAGNLYSGNRQIYNIFYVRNMSGNSVAEQFGQYAATAESNNASTKVAAYEDGNNYVYVLATGLQDMYRRFSAGAAVQQWARQVVYVRPELFVVYDRTTAGSASYDQYMAWHFPASPTAGTAVAGENRIDVTYAGTYAGAMTTVLPQNATLTTLAMYPSDNPVKAWQVQVRAPAAATSQQWLTVFDLAGSAAAAATVKPITVSQGNILGVQMAAAGGNAVVVSSAGSAGTPLTGTIAYSVDNLAARHVITDLAPSTGYTVTITANGSLWNVSVAAGGSSMSSAKGVLSFVTSGNGNPPPQPPPPVTTPLPPPVSSLPVPGFPVPYQG